MAKNFPQHSITQDTVKNLLFKACVLVANFKWGATADDKPTYDPLGASSGGTSLNVEPEYLDAELDNATVKIKGGTFKASDKAVAKGNFTEITPDIIQKSLHLEEAENQDMTGWTKYVSKPAIDDADYLDNVALIGTLVDGRNCVAVLPNAICLSALELETESKKQATFELEFECTADITQSDLTHLPYELYFEDAAV